MKTTLLACLVLLNLPLLGQEQMENSDFSDGTTHWHGDCKPSGSEMTTDFTANPPSAKGIVVELHSTSWTKVTQAMRSDKIPPRANMVLTVVYQTSPDLKLSTRDADYANVGGAVGLDGARLKGRPGEVLALIDVPPLGRASVSLSSSADTYTFVLDSVAGTGFVPVTDPKQQTFTARLNPPHSTSNNNPTFCLAFPPGTGSVTLLQVSLAPATDAGDPGAPGMPPHG